jgi:hypothetical protein
MKLYNPCKTSLNLNGLTYTADENGIITIPDDQLNSSVWTQGFISAHANLDRRAAVTETQSLAPPAPALSPSPAPAEPPNTTKSK